MATEDPSPSFEVGDLETRRREMGVQQLFAPQVRVVADQVRDASNSDLEGTLEQLRQARTNLDLLISMGENLPEQTRQANER